VDALNPELDVAVLARDPADPRIETPASEQPRWDIGRLSDRYDLADNTQLPFGALVHGLIFALPGGHRHLVACFAPVLLAGAKSQVSGHRV
jgi:hypothetical protein